MTWELDGLDFAPLEFSTTRNRRSQTAGLIIHRVTALPPQHISVVAGLRVTSVPRTLVDLGAVVPAEILELALESALRRHLTTRDEMRAALEWSSPTQAGKGMLRRLLDDDFTTATESALETLAWQVFRDEGLPLPARQYEVRDQRKRFVARVDFAYPEARLALEVDGYEHHSSRKDWRRDRRRQNALIRLGWTVYRVTWEDIMHRGHVVADDLRGLLAGSLAKFVR